MKGLFLYQKLSRCYFESSWANNIRKIAFLFSIRFSSVPWQLLKMIVLRYYAFQLIAGLIVSALTTLKENEVRTYEFPEYFVIGAESESYQIEGEILKVLNIWEKFSCKVVRVWIRRLQAFGTPCFVQSMTCSQTLVLIPIISSRKMRIVDGSILRIIQNLRGQFDRSDKKEDRKRFNSVPSRVYKEQKIWLLMKKEFFGLDDIFLGILIK